MYPTIRRTASHFFVSPLFVSSNRSNRLPLTAVAILSAICMVAPAGALAQTAHFGGVVNTLGSGFAGPFGVAVDASGDIFVADTYGNAVKEIVAVNGSIPASPTILTLGSGFGEPTGVAVDASGNVFVADHDNSAVKEILAAGGYTTVNTLGSGFSYLWGVAVDASGDVFVGDEGSGTVKEILAAGGYTTVNTLGSGFYFPAGVAVDASGNVFVADEGSGTVQEILAAGGYTTVNTLGSGFNSPYGVSVDGSGNVFVADSFNYAVKEMVAVDGSIPASPTILTLGSGFSLPLDVTVDASGNVFVADLANSAVKEISPANFGSVPVGTTSTPQSLTFNFDSPGTLAATPYVVLTQGAANLDFQAASSQPASVCITGQTYNAGDSCTVDVTFTPTHPGERMGAVQLMASGGTPIATGLAHGIGTGPQVIFPSNNTPVALGSGFSNAIEMVVDASGDIFVADRNNNAVEEIVAVSGSIPASPTIRTLGSGFLNPFAVAVDGSGDVFVADSSNGAVKEMVAVNGSIPAIPTILTLGSGFSSPRAVAVDASGDVFVTDYFNNAVEEIVAVNGSIPATPTILTLGSGFSHPYALAVDGSGDVFVADYYNNAVKEIVAVNGSIPASPTILTLGSGFSFPTGVAVDGRGDVFVADLGNNALKEMVAVNGSIPVSPTILTLGSGLSSPWFVAVDGSGNVFVADADGEALQEIPYATAPSLSFASTSIGSTSSDSPQTVTVANDGNADLSFTVPITGLNPSLSNNNFTFGNSSTCPQLDTSSSAATLAPGASCTDLISFSPTAIGPMTGMLAITDTHLNANPSVTQPINLSGTATQATQTITFPQPATPVTYGAAPVTLAATSSSGLTVSYVVTGPAAISGSSLTITGAGTVMVTASQAGDTDHSAATPVSDTIVVNPAALTVTAANATRVVGAANPALTGSYAGAVNGDTFTVSVTTTATASSAPGTYPITPTIAGTNLADYGVSYVNGTLTITAPGIAGTTTTLTANPTSITAGGSATLTATVASSSGTPAGTVTFTSGGTSLGTADLSAGVATLTITTLPVGTDTITASYGGAATFAASSGSASVSVNAATPPSYTVVPASPTLSTTQGQNATTTLTLTPVGGYSGTVVFSCQNLPANATCVFAQSPVKLTGDNQPVKVGLTIETDVQQARITATPRPTQSPLNPVLPALAFWWPGSLAGLAAIGRKRKLSKTQQRWLQLCLLLVVTGALAGGLSGCGGTRSNVTPTGATTVTVTATATSGSNVTTQTATLTLTITQ